MSFWLQLNCTQLVQLATWRMFFWEYTWNLSFGELVYIHGSSKDGSDDRLQQSVNSTEPQREREREREKERTQTQEKNDKTKKGESRTRTIERERERARERERRSQSQPRRARQ